MKKILAIALVLLANGIAGTAYAAPECSVYLGDPLLANNVPVGAVMRHGDGSWQVQCPQITVKASVPQGATYYVSAGGNTLYTGTAESKTFTLPNVSDYSINVQAMPDGYTAQTSSDCGGTLTYGDRKECDITFTAPAPAPVASASPVFVQPSAQTAPDIGPVSAPVAPEATSTPEPTIITQEAVTSGIQGTTTTRTTITVPHKARVVAKPIDPLATTTVSVATESAKDAEIVSLKDEVRHLINIILALLQQIASLKAPTF